MIFRRPLSISIFFFFSSLDPLIYIWIINMKKLGTSDWLKTTAFFMYCTCKLRIAQVLPKFNPSWLSMTHFSCKLLTSNKMIFVQFGVNKHYRLVKFFCLWKIYSCLSTPNCHQNCIVTYTNTGHKFLPEWQCSLISLNLSLTDDALRPMAAPIVAQSLPCFSFKDFSCSTSSEEYFPI